MNTANILRAKQILKHLWKQSGLKRDEVLVALSEHGLTLPKSTLNTWYSLKENRVIRPKYEYILPLIEICCPQKNPAEIQALAGEVNLLLGYQTVPASTESLLNKMYGVFNQETFAQLSEQQCSLAAQYGPLTQLLSEIEAQIFEYEKGYPVIRLEKGQHHLLKKCLGENSQDWKKYATQTGYEIPLTQVKSLETLTEIIDTLNEGVRVLRAYVDRHLSGEFNQGFSGVQRIEDFVGYAWEITNCLLFNPLCQQAPYHKTLMKIVAVCCGIRYLLNAQQGKENDIEFQNLLRLKGYASEADIHCSIGVYMGILSRKLLQPGGSRALMDINKGFALFQNSVQRMETHHHHLAHEHDVFYYKRELANLYFDTATLLLRQTAPFHENALSCQHLMTQAHRHYSTILQTANLFFQGLSETRAVHIRLFHTISNCWISDDFPHCVAEINKLMAGQQLNQHFWQVHLGQALAFGILAHRSAAAEAKACYIKLGEPHIHKAQLVPGFEAQTQQEMAQDFILNRIYAI